MTATIKRYGLVSGKTFSWIDEVPNGRYVKYYDHVEEVTALQARVAELEDADLHVVTAVEKAVLDACAAAELGEDDPYADPTEPQEVGEDCYIYADDQHAIARAELARREAAK